MPNGPQTNRQKIDRALRVEIAVVGCGEFVRIDKTELFILKDRVGGWNNMVIEVDGSTARVVVQRPV